MALAASSAYSFNPANHSARQSICQPLVARTTAVTSCSGGNSHLEHRCCCNLLLYSLFEVFDLCF